MSSQEDIIAEALSDEKYAKIFGQDALKERVVFRNKKKEMQE